LGKNKRDQNENRFNEIMKLDSKTIVILIFLAISLIISAYFVWDNNIKKGQINMMENQISSLENQITSYQTLSSDIVEYLDLLSKPCDASASDITGVTSCVSNLIQQIKAKPKIEAQLFSKPLNALVVINKGDINLDSRKFQLYVNDELVDSNGCEAGGEVIPNGACKLYMECETGDTVKVLYDYEIVLTQVC